MTLSLVILFVCAFWAGIQNALAGGGSFITLPALMFTGLDARAANITSTLALFPGQVTTGLAGRSNVSGLPELSFKALFIISLIGGALGGVLLLATPSKIFEFLIPWLILGATSVFVWGNFFRKDDPNAKPLHKNISILWQFLIAIYGGYFGGGIGILMMAAFTLARMDVRKAGATKNVLAGVLNASAVVIFLFSNDIAWLQAGIAAVAAIGGGQVGAYMLKRVNIKLLKIFVATLGFALTLGMFARTYGLL